MKTTVTEWDTSEYLDSPEMIREYLIATLEDGDADALKIALGNIAKAQGMGKIADKAKLNRQNLYKALSPNGSPKLDTIVKVLQAFNLKLTVEPIQ